MTIQEVCYRRLINLHQPGGESINLDSSSKINIIFLKGGDYLDNTFIEGQVTNLSLNSSSVFDPDCFEYGCVSGGGIWTEVITSNITRVVNNTTQYWIEGTLDSNQNLWVLDIGFINPITGDFVIEDKSVPINNKGIFKTRIKISPYTKLAILRKITLSTVTSIINHFGTYKSGVNISRSKVGYILEYNAVDQLVELEDLSIGLLSLLFTEYKHEEVNQKSYYLKGDLDSGISKIIEDNLIAINSLIDFKSETFRVNSIPKYLTTYLDNNLLYTDKYYLDNIVRCFEEGCFDSECFEAKEVFLTSSREVSTRAIAWFYILVYSYSLYLKTDSYLYILDLLASYLVNQLDLNNLPSEGWTHSNILSESLEITTYNLSTAVISYICLLKHYEYTNNPFYLEKATDIKEGIYTNLFNFKTKEFRDSTTDSTKTITSYTYGLLFSLLENRIDVVENLVDIIENNLTVDYGIIKERLDNNAVVNIDKLSADQLNINPENISFTNLNYQGTGLLDLAKENTLLYFALDLTKEYSINLQPKTVNYLNTFNNVIDQVEVSNRIVNTSYCFTNLNPFALEPITNNFYLNSFNLTFERAKLINVIKSYIPTGYGWFSEKALSLTGNLYTILKLITQSIATYYVHSKHILNSNNLQYSTGFNLNQQGSKYSFTRLLQETDKSYKSYISDIFSGIDNKITISGIVKSLSRIGVDIIISEPFLKIFNFNTTKQSSSFILGEGYYSGEDYASTNIVEVSTNRPLNSIIVNEIHSALPISTKLLLNEVLSFDVDLILSDSCFIYSNEDTQLPTEYYVIQEDVAINSLFLQENLDPVSQENLDPITLYNSTITTNQVNYILEETLDKIQLE